MLLKEEYAVSIHSIPSHLCMACFFGHQPVYHLANGVRMKNKKAASRAQDNLGFSYTKKTHYCEEMGRAAGGVLESRRGLPFYAIQEFRILKVIFCTISPLRCPYFNLPTHEYSISPWSEKRIVVLRVVPQELFNILHIEL